jgi:hypothetical protein
MAHYAFVDENNIVIEVIVGRNEKEIVDGISDWESHYAEFRTGLRCFRTSYNTFAGVHKEGGIPFRKNYAGIGYTYDEERDAFIPPKPDDFTDEEGNSFTFIFNEETCQWDTQKI